MKHNYIDAEEVKVVPKDDQANFKKRLFRLLGAWPLFLLSLLLCGALAYFYIRSAPPIYQAVASLMVKDENKGADLVYNKALEEMGLGVNTKLVENEMEVLRSYDLLANVVDSLQLFHTTRRSDKMRQTALYGDEAPFSIEILNPRSITRSRDWLVLQSKDGFSFQAEADKKPIPINWKQEYQSNGTRFRFLPTAALSNEELFKEEQRYSVSIVTPEEAIEDFGRTLSVDAASKVATVINLSIRDVNRRRAAVILETLISTFKRQGIDNKNVVLDNTINFLNDRLAIVSDELRQVEGSVEKFKSANRVTELSSDAEQYLSQARQVDEQKAATQTQLNIISALEDDIVKNQDNPKVVPSSFGITDPGLGSLIEKHNDLVLQKEKLEQKAGPKNPLLVEQQNQIKELRTRLLTSVNNLKHAYNITLDNISTKDVQMNSRIRNVPQLEKRLLQITRNQNVQEQLYAFLLQKREEAAVSRMANIEDSQVIVSARGLDPVAPKKQVIWIMAILIGFLLPIAFISVKDFLDNKVGDLQQIQQKTALPLLGIVSHVRKLKHPIIVSMRSRSAVAEQIRNIRTAISHNGKTDGLKTILVTSFQSGDGKSFVSLNLAAGYALLNKKTVIVEFDLRRPGISTSLGIEAEQGVSTVLNGKTSVEEVLIMLPGFYNNLFLLPAGHLPTNPAELISGNRMDHLIATLQKNFDYIIIDTPPFSLVADATLLQQYADKTVMVLRQDYTSRQVYDELDRWKSGQPEQSTYVVVNDVGKARRYHEANGYVYDRKYYHDAEV